ncbi:MAG: HNH endonuclease signature motif containing protein, partial [Candidatus Hodarchaeales archaeon]
LEKSKIQFCSQDCYKKSRRRTTECSWCKKQFHPQRLSQYFCSIKCFSEWRKKKKRTEFWYENGYKVLSLGDGRGIKEHIKIMQDQIGRNINRKNEIVHHKNGMRDDNRPENLELMSRKQHASYHRNKEKSHGKDFFGR